MEKIMAKTQNQEIEPKTNTITIRVDVDVLQWFKDYAEKSGTKYQTLLKRAMYEYMLNQQQGTQQQDLLRKLVAEEIVTFFQNLTKSQ